MSENRRRIFSSKFENQEISTENETKIYILSIKGDTSGDGNITILDLLQVQKNILGLYKITQ